jgi:hypothetical protein
VKQVIVFAFVCLAWIFFRARTMTDAWTILSGIFTKPWGDPKFPILMGVLLVAVWLYEELFSRGPAHAAILELEPGRVALALAMVLWLAVVAVPSTKAFIYFDF